MKGGSRSRPLARAPGPATFDFLGFTFYWARRAPFGAPSLACGSLRLAARPVS
jgi:hypothetical protein